VRVRGCGCCRESARVWVCHSRLGDSVSARLAAAVLRMSARVSMSLAISTWPYVSHMMYDFLQQDFCIKSAKLP